MAITWAEALAESEARGSANSTRGAILLYLEHRFGRVPEELKSKLEAIGEPSRLFALLESAFEAASLRGFEAAVAGAAPSDLPV